MREAALLSYNIGIAPVEFTEMRCRLTMQCFARD